MKIDNKPVFSIICPFFNGEHFIKEAINSVLIQSFTDWELILVDDGSNDNSSSIAMSFQSKNIKYFKNTNHGVLYSRYYGINNSLGSYIVFLDCDDILPENALKIYFEYLTKYNPDIIFSNISTFSEEGYSTKIYSNKGFMILDDRSKFLNCYFDNRFGYFHSAACFSRKLFDNHQLPDLFGSFTFTEDLIDTFFLIKDANKILLIEEDLYHYRKHSSSKLKSNMKQDDYFQGFMSYNYIYSYLKSVITIGEYPECLIRDLSFNPIMYFIGAENPDSYELFKLRSKEIKKSYLYRSFTLKYKFKGKRYFVYKLLMRLSLYKVLYKFCISQANK